MPYGTEAKLSGAGQAINPARLSEVQEQMQRSARAMGRLEEKFKSLHDRLQPVLRGGDHGQAEASNPKPTLPTLVGHANALSNHNDQLEMFDSMLGEILDRLEL